MDNADNRQNPHQTQGFPAFQQAPPPGFAPSEPRFLTPQATGRRRGPVVLALVLGIAVALMLGFVVGLVVINDEPTPSAFARQVSGQSPAQQPSQDNGSPAGPAAGAPAAAPGGGSEFDLRKGAVLLQSNDPTKNEVVALARNVTDGRLHEVGRYPTGGVGSGSFEDTANGLVLGTNNGEASPQQNLDSAQMLFVTNAGSNTITSFRVNADGLELVSTVPSGGEKPVSLTVNRGTVYALNSGELDDRFILDFNTLQFLENCSHGEQPTVSGFHVSDAGELTPIANSVRPLSGGSASGCAQVSFTPDGSKLVVSERTATLPLKEPGKGAIVTFEVQRDGTLGAKKVHDAAGVGPFGFSFTKDGTLLVTEQNHAMDGQGKVSSYTMLEDGTPKAISRSVPDQQTDTCWIEPTNDGKLAFSSSALGGGSISAYRIDETGALTLAQASATAEPGKDPKDDHLQNGTTDLGLSRDSKFLYQLNSHFGMLHVFRVNPDGHLTFVEEHKVFDVVLPENGGQLTPFGIAAF